MKNKTVKISIQNRIISGAKGIAKRAVKDTAKAAIGVDQGEVNRRADRSQDQEAGVGQVFRSLEGVQSQTSEKKGGS